ncbi:hypothetical protein KKD37_03360 [Patescibacteria group bacterium]|nr:hypothetical protein [Patescibacteria group bacterium]
MNLGWHIVAGTVMGAIVKNQWPAIMMGMVGVDLVDHGLFGITKVRPLTMKNCWNTGISLYKKSEGKCYVFHSIEVYSLVLLLVFRFDWGKWFMLAYSTHLLMDIIWYLLKRRDLKWVKWWSLGWWVAGKK